MIIDLQLPYPPSVNHYWRFSRTRPPYISPAGRLYRKLVKAAIPANTQPVTDNLYLIVHAFPPDRRRRDIDNIAKALLDALACAGLYADDSQIKILHMEMHDQTPHPPNGHISLTIHRI